MINIVGVRFKNTNKIYYFNPEDKRYKKGEKVIVETVRGVEIGEVVLPNRNVPQESVIMPLNPVQRRAEGNDFKKQKENKAKEKEAFDIWNKKRKERGLDMKLINVECTLGSGKMLFYITSDGRVDFHELV